MHLLLPPSETKTTGGRGRALHGRFADDALGRARSVTTRALLELVDGAPRAAATALQLPDGVAGDALAANAAVLVTPTTPALRRYSGIVYDGFSVATMTPGEQRVAARRTLVFSGLFGVVRGDESVPNYRVPAKAVLPGIGVASTFWRPVLAGVLPTMLRRGLVVDLRSGDYAAMWRPDAELARRIVTIRVLSPAPRGGHVVISYNSKYAKGLLAASLVRRMTAGQPAHTADDVAAAWVDCGGHHCRSGPDGTLELYTG
ncbi:MAG: peroxide stress protein YaaA [Actinomycetota bacterium]|nr:peroxide stress protein YaaA [Actinomycetota bacterium]